MSGFFLGIDTSNYTTSIGLCDENGNVCANLKRPVPVAAGERGVRQSDAVFAHVKNFQSLAEEFRDVLRGQKILAVGVSTAPRTAEGSYMPCFLAGKAVADMIAAAENVPVCCFSHQQGHVAAAAYSCEKMAYLAQKPFLAFHVSGGTTEALLVDPGVSGYEYQIEKLGGTADISMGQAIDRVGVYMGLSFPCGKEMELLASQNKTKLPPLKISVENVTCNLSGLENKAVQLYNETKDAPLVAAYTFSFVEKTLCSLTENAVALYPNLPVLFSGGVMSNMLMRNALSSLCEAYFAQPAFSADNAAGISVLTYYRSQQQ